MEEGYWRKDRLVDKLFIINTGNDTDSDETSDSDTNSEPDVDYMSGAEDKLTGLDIMRTTQIAQYALRLTYSQPANREKMMSRSALLLAALGLGLSTFSVRQMIISQTRRV
ncbi:hypothetical protein K1T71_014151 [Dendrolimus kikuchii]|uniref:Uncharacterized protein n=1 Tax=Dendrolimus kikuchii TaxID=765133 RepID=A0ACC1CF56_9NEOP|nr:hypothetical protein K1T71_014151 [Dendrolimus kikuchii]